MNVGDKVGMNTLLEKIGRGYHRDAIWKCECDCGNIFYVTTSTAKKGNGCGCKIKNKLVGEKFGRLLVLKDSTKRTKQGNIIYQCKCDCGNIVYVSSNNLSTKCNKTVSCGCYNTERKTKHNSCYTRLYKKYMSMKQRCYNQNNPHYKDYGGRGIKVCDEWLNDFTKFEKWSYANGYDDNLGKWDCTIDRIDNDSDYRPDNCRWVDMKTQLNNTRRNKKNKDLYH